MEIAKLFRNMYILFDMLSIKSVLLHVSIDSIACILSIDIQSWLTISHKSLDRSSLSASSRASPVGISHSWVHSSSPSSPAYRLLYTQPVIQTHFAVSAFRLSFCQRTKQFRLDFDLILLSFNLTVSTLNCWHLQEHLPPLSHSPHPAWSTMACASGRGAAWVTGGDNKLHWARG